MKKIKQYTILFLIIVAAGIFLSLSYTFAKYVGNNVWEYYLSTKNFYISSDLIDGKNKEIKAWDKERIYFEITNSENNLKITEYDIDYELTCESSEDIKCLLNGEDSLEGILSSSLICIDNEENIQSLNKKDCLLNGYNWKAEKTIKNIYLDIIFNNEELETLNVKLTFKSTSPYKKEMQTTLTLKNTIKDNENIILDYIDNINTGDLILTNPSLKSKIINISYDEDKILIDKEDKKIDSYDEESIYIKLNKKESINLKIYKPDNEINITKEDFTLNLINEKDYKKEELLINDILNQNGGIDDLLIKELSNNDGLYHSEDSYGNSFFFKGQEINNNIIFGNKLWKIARINGNNSVKLILNGACEENVCINETLQLQNWGDELYLNSNIKLQLDNWYKQNIENKELNEYIKDTLFCEDLSKEEETYKTNIRFNLNTPNVKCNKNYSHTKSDVKKGDGHLSYPVGLLTLDEALEGGAYLNKGETYWLISPSDENSKYIYNYLGVIESSNISNTHGLRPVINIDGNIRINGDGSLNNPYTIKK